MEGDGKTQWEAQLNAMVADPEYMALDEGAKRQVLSNFFRGEVAPAISSQFGVGYDALLREDEPGFIDEWVATVKKKDVADVSSTGSQPVSSAPQTGSTPTEAQLPLSQAALATRFPDMTGGSGLAPAVKPGETRMSQVMAGPAEVWKPSTGETVEPAPFEAKPLPVAAPPPAWKEFDIRKQQADPDGFAKLTSTLLGETVTQEELAQQPPQKFVREDAFDLPRITMKESAVSPIVVPPDQPLSTPTNPAVKALQDKYVLPANEEKAKAQSLAIQTANQIQNGGQEKDANFFTAASGNPDVYAFIEQASAQEADSRRLLTDDINQVSKLTGPGELKERTSLHATEFNNPHLWDMFGIRYKGDIPVLNLKNGQMSKTDLDNMLKTDMKFFTPEKGWAVGKKDIQAVMTELRQVDGKLMLPFVDLKTGDIDYTSDVTKLFEESKDGIYGKTAIDFYLNGPQKRYTGEPGFLSSNLNSFTGGIYATMAYGLETLGATQQLAGKVIGAAGGMGGAPDEGTMTRRIQEGLHKGAQALVQYQARNYATPAQKQDIASSVFKGGLGSAVSSMLPTMLAVAAGAPVIAAGSLSMVQTIGAEMNSFYDAKERGVKIEPGQEELMYASGVLQGGLDMAGMIPMFKGIEAVFGPSGAKKAIGSFISRLGQNAKNIPGAMVAEGVTEGAQNLVSSTGKGLTYDKKELPVAAFHTAVDLLTEGPGTMARTGEIWNKGMENDQTKNLVVETVTGGVFGGWMAGVGAVGKAIRDNPTKSTAEIKSMLDALTPEQIVQLADEADKETKAMTQEQQAKEKELAKSMGLEPTPEELADASREEYKVWNEQKTQYAADKAQSAVLKDAATLGQITQEQAENGPDLTVHIHDAVNKLQLDKVFTKEERGEFSKLWDTFITDVVFSSLTDDTKELLTGTATTAQKTAFEKRLRDVMGQKIDAYRELKKVAQERQQTEVDDAASTLNTLHWDRVLKGEEKLDANPLPITPDVAKDLAPTIYEIAKNKAPTIQPNLQEVGGLRKYYGSLFGLVQDELIARGVDEASMKGLSEVMSDSVWTAAKETMDAATQQEEKLSPQPIPADATQEVQDQESVQGERVGSSPVVQEEGVNRDIQAQEPEVSSEASGSDIVQREAQSVGQEDITVTPQEEVAPPRKARAKEAAPAEVKQEMAAAVPQPAESVSTPGEETLSVRAYNNLLSLRNLIKENKLQSHINNIADATISRLYNDVVFNITNQAFDWAKLNSEVEAYVRDITRQTAVGQLTEAAWKQKVRAMNVVKELARKGEIGAYGGSPKVMIALIEALTELNDDVTGKKARRVAVLEAQRETRKAVKAAAAALNEFNDKSRDSIGGAISMAGLGGLGGIWEPSQKLLTTLAELSYRNAYEVALRVYEVTGNFITEPDYDALVENMKELVEFPSGLLGSSTDFNHPAVRSAIYASAQEAFNEIAAKPLSEWKQRNMVRGKAGDSIIKAASVRASEAYAQYLKYRRSEEEVNLKEGEAYIYLHGVITNEKLLAAASLWIDKQGGIDKAAISLLNRTGFSIDGVIDPDGSFDPEIGVALFSAAASIVSATYAEASEQERLAIAQGKDGASLEVQDELMEKAAEIHEHLAKLTRQGGRLVNAYKLATSLDPRVKYHQQLKAIVNRWQYVNPIRDIVVDIQNNLDPLYHGNTPEQASAKKAEFEAEARKIEDAVLAIYGKQLEAKAEELKAREEELKALEETLRAQLDEIAKKLEELEGKEKEAAKQTQLDVASQLLWTELQAYMAAHGGTIEDALAVIRREEVFSKLTPEEMLTLMGRSFIAAQEGQEQEGVVDMAQVEKFMEELAKLKKERKVKAKNAPEGEAQEVTPPPSDIMEAAAKRLARRLVADAENSNTQPFALNFIVSHLYTLAHDQFRIPKRTLNPLEQLLELIKFAQNPATAAAVNVLAQQHILNNASPEVQQVLKQYLDGVINLKYPEKKIEESLKEAGKATGFTYSTNLGASMFDYRSNAVDAQMVLTEEETNMPPAKKMSLADVVRYAYTSKQDIRTVIAQYVVQKYQSYDKDVVQSVVDEMVRQLNETLEAKREKELHTLLAATAKKARKELEAERSLVHGKSNARLALEDMWDKVITGRELRGFAKKLHVMYNLNGFSDTAMMAAGVAEYMGMTSSFTDAELATIREKVDRMYRVKEGSVRAKLRAEVDEMFAKKMANYNFGLFMDWTYMRLLSGPSTWITNTVSMLFQAIPATIGTLMPARRKGPLKGFPSMTFKKIGWMWQQLAGTVFNKELKNQVADIKDYTSQWKKAQAIMGSVWHGGSMEIDHSASQNEFASRSAIGQTGKTPRGRARIGVQNFVRKMVSIPDLAFWGSARDIHQMSLLYDGIDNGSIDIIPGMSIEEQVEVMRFGATDVDGAVAAIGEAQEQARAEVLILNEGNPSYDYKADPLYRRRVGELLQESFKNRHPHIAAAGAWAGGFVTGNFWADGTLGDLQRLLSVRLEVLPTDPTGVAIAKVALKSIIVPFIRISSNIALTLPIMRMSPLAAISIRSDLENARKGKEAKTMTDKEYKEVVELCYTRTQMATAGTLWFTLWVFNAIDWSFGDDEAEDAWLTVTGSGAGNTARTRQSRNTRKPFTLYMMKGAIQIPLTSLGPLGTILRSVGEANDIMYYKDAQQSWASTENKGTRQSIMKKNINKVDAGGFAAAWALRSIPAVAALPSFKEINQLLSIAVGSYGPQSGAQAQNMAARILAKASPTSLVDIKMFDFLSDVVTQKELIASSPNFGTNYLENVMINLPFASAYSNRVGEFGLPRLVINTNCFGMAITPNRMEAKIMEQITGVRQIGDTALLGQGKSAREAYYREMGMTAVEASDKATKDLEEASKEPSYKDMKGFETATAKALAHNGLKMPVPESNIEMYKFDRDGNVVASHQTSAEYDRQVVITGLTGMAIFNKSIKPITYIKGELLRRKYAPMSAKTEKAVTDIVNDAIKRPEEFVKDKDGRYVQKLDKQGKPMFMPSGARVFAKSPYNPLTMDFNRMNDLVHDENGYIHRAMQAVIMGEHINNDAGALKKYHDLEVAQQAMDKANTE